MEKQKRDRSIAIALAVVAVVLTVLFGGSNFITLSVDERLNRLLLDCLSRVGVGAFLVFSYYTLITEQKPPMPEGKALKGTLIWCIPCLFVALANFPYSALISGSAVVERWELLGLFVLKCVLVAVVEEFFFRGILYPIFFDRLKKKNRASLLTVLSTAAVFSLWHLINLFAGAPILPTLLQLSYTFLLGCMFAAVYEKSGMVWVCVLLHAIFDVGGLVIPDLGQGAFQDLTFWILTAVFGAICTVHVGYYLLKKK